MVWGVHLSTPFQETPKNGVLRHFHARFASTMTTLRWLHSQMQMQPGAASQETIPDANHGAGIFTYMTGPWGKCRLIIHPWSIGA